MSNAVTAFVALERVFMKLEMALKYVLCYVVWLCVIYKSDEILEAALLGRNLKFCALFLLLLLLLVVVVVVLISFENTLP